MLGALSEANLQPAESGPAEGLCNSEDGIFHDMDTLQCVGDLRGLPHHLGARVSTTNQQRRLLAAAARWLRKREAWI